MYISSLNFEERTRAIERGQTEQTNKETRKRSIDKCIVKSIYRGREKDQGEIDFSTNRTREGQTLGSATESTSKIYNK